MNDALGNEVILGNTYGYSTTDNVIIGRAVKFTTEKVSLIPTKRRFFCYGEEHQRAHYEGKAKVIHIWSYHLFPVKEQE